MNKFRSIFLPLVILGIFTGGAFLAGIYFGGYLVIKDKKEAYSPKEPCFPYVLPPVAEETPPKAQPKAQPVPVEKEEEAEEDNWEEEWELKLKIEEEKRETLRKVHEMEIENERSARQLEQSQKDFDAYWEQQHSQQLWDKAIDSLNQPEVEKL